MNIQIIASGKIKEKYLTAALDEYVKRISRFARVEIIETADEKIPENASEKEAERVKEREGERILAKLRRDAYVIAMCIEGRQYSSEGLADMMGRVMMRSSAIAFVIGGSLGLSDAVKRAADERVSFGPITLPHQLMRVVLAEQIYRGFKILNNESYHK